MNKDWKTPSGSRQSSLRSSAWIKKQNLGFVNEFLGLMELFGRGESISGTEFFGFSGVRGCFFNGAWGGSPIKSPAGLLGARS
jgi:hypothetical protein